MLLAVLVRLVVCAVLGPNGSDDHYQVIAFILREHRLPPSNLFAQSFHPPLYHLLAVPWALVGGARAVEVFSLLLSIANAWLLVRLVRDCSGGAGRAHATLLIALLPQLVLFSIVVSNDSLAMLVGTLAILTGLRFLREPSARNATWAGVAAGIGLLTKGTLAAHALVLFALIAIVAFRRRALHWVAIFAALTIALGSYKFIENQRELGRPIVHNMDSAPDWMTAQQPTVLGVRSWIDLDLRKLWREPYAEHPDGTWTNPRSIPLLLYATFWHPYVPVSNFRAVFRFVPIVGRVTYVLAILPTLLILVGLRRNLLLAAFLAANVAIVIGAGVRYDAWSCFQSRLFFPAFASIALAYAWGIETVVQRWPRMEWPIHFACAALYASFVLDHAVEIGNVIATHLQ